MEISFRLKTRNKYLCYRDLNFSTCHLHFIVQELPAADQHKAEEKTETRTAFPLGGVFKKNEECQDMKKLEQTLPLIYIEEVPFLCLWDWIGKMNGEDDGEDKQTILIEHALF